MQTVSLDHLKQTAISAHAGTSFSPEKRGNSTISEFTSELNEDIATIVEAAEKYDQDPAAAISRYKEKYEKYLSGWLHSRSGIVSSMIAGPSNFPVRQMQKRNQWAENKWSEFREWRSRVIRKICKSFAPTTTPLTELEQAQKNLQEREAAQEQMKKINAAYRAFKKKPETLDKSDLSDAAKRLIRNFEPKYSWEKGPYESYRLSNNNQNIARLRERIKYLQGKAQLHQAGEQIETIIGEVRIVNNFEADRVQIFFPGKPAPEMISTLKARGWHWSPFNKCWQRKLTSDAIYCAKSIIS